VNLEERVNAIKAKFEEATQELLDLVSEHPSQLSDIMQLAHPNMKKRSPIAVRRVIESTLSAPPDCELLERFEVRNVFFEAQPLSFRHELDPVDVIIPQGEVYILVAMQPENEKRSELLRELNGKRISGEEYHRRHREIRDEEDMLYETTESGDWSQYTSLKG